MNQTPPGPPPSTSTRNPTDWVDLSVVLDAESLTLSIESPELSLEFGRPVRWRFLHRSADGRLGPLPVGWCPVLAFYDGERGQPTEGFGPFGSLLQVVPSAAEAEGMQLVGEWPREPPRDDRSFYYFAAVHRGLGLDHIAPTSLLASALTRLSVDPRPFEGSAAYVKPTPPGDHRVELKVVREPENPERLIIQPSAPVRSFTNSTLSWTFHHLDAVYPLVLFYASEHLADAPGTAKNHDFFEPHRYCRTSAQGVEVWGFKDVPRRCFYEAAGLRRRRLAMEMLSTGDPQIDNQGIPFPPFGREESE